MWDMASVASMIEANVAKQARWLRFSLPFRMLRRSLQLT